MIMRASTTYALLIAPVRKKLVGNCGLPMNGASPSPFVCRQTRKSSARPAASTYVRGGAGQRAIGSQQIELAADAGDGEDEGVEENRVGVPESREVPDDCDGRKRGKDERKDRLTPASAARTRPKSSRKPARVLSTKKLGTLRQNVATSSNGTFAAEVAICASDRPEPANRRPSPRRRNSRPG